MKELRHRARVRSWAVDRGISAQTLALMADQALRQDGARRTGHAQPPEAIKQWEERIRVAQTQGMKAARAFGRWSAGHAVVRESPPAKEKSRADRQHAGRRLRRLRQAINELTPPGALKEIKLPVLRLPAKPILPRRDAPHRETVPGAKLVMIPQAAHISNVEQAATFNQGAGNFL